MAKAPRAYTPRTKVTSATFSGLASFEGAANAANMEFLMEGAEIVAAAARTNASKFSQRIPAATKATPTGPSSVAVITDGSAAPNAAPFEFGKRHPLFGDTNHWYKQPTRAYMNRAFKATVAEVVDVYGKAADAMTEAAGYH